jgi:hypothetical protein
MEASSMRPEPDDRFSSGERCAGRRIGQPSWLIARGREAAKYGLIGGQRLRGR